MTTPMLLVMGLTACGGTGVGNGRPTIVVTTSVLGDVVRNLVGDQAEVDVLMPAGVDPHEFVPSSKQAVSLREADAVVANGAGFEAGLRDALDAAGHDGVDVLNVIDSVDRLGGHGKPIDPHFFTDPGRMVVAAGAIVDHLVKTVPALDADRLRSHAAGYLDQLKRLDTDVEQILAVVPAERRKLVTNHDVFTYFADRYGFELIGAVIPGKSTGSEPSAGQLATLARTITSARVPAIFADSSSPKKLADALADEAGSDVKVVELFTESLKADDPAGDSYIHMLTTDAHRIADALT